MNPIRKEVIGDFVLEEYYWAGSYPCYVNNQLSRDSFDRTKEFVLNGQEPNLISLRSK